MPLYYLSMCIYSGTPPIRTLWNKDTSINRMPCPQCYVCNPWNQDTSLIWTLSSVVLIETSTVYLSTGCNCSQWILWSSGDSIWWRCRGSAGYSRPRSGGRVPCGRPGPLLPGDPCLSRDTEGRGWRDGDSLIHTGCHYCTENCRHCSWYPTKQNCLQSKKNRYVEIFVNMKGLLGLAQYT